MRKQYIGLTEEQKVIFRDSYNAAVAFFGLEKGQVLHHVNPDLKQNDIDRYIQWNPEDLVVMTKAEHAALHNHLRGSRSEETKKKISESVSKNNAACKRTRCIDTGEEYASAEEAALHFGLNGGDVRKVCTGQQKSTKGLHFEYVK